MVYALTSPPCPARKPPTLPLSARRAGRGRREKGSRQAVTREGSSTIEKRTPALWRLFFGAPRPPSSASLPGFYGPLPLAPASPTLVEVIGPDPPPLTPTLLR